MDIEADIGDLSELVIVHAGNPEEGCCGIWIGAPIAPEEIESSPWAWLEPLWLAEVEDIESVVDASPKAATPRHDQLPEPTIVLEPIPEEEAEDHAEDR